MTLKLSRNAKKTGALTGRHPVHPTADDDFEIVINLFQVLSLLNTLLLKIIMCKRQTKKKFSIISCRILYQQTKLAAGQFKSVVTSNVSGNSF